MNRLKLIFALACPPLAFLSTVFGNRAGLNPRWQEVAFGNLTRPPLIRRINFLCFAQRFFWLLKSWHAVYLYACPLQLHRRAASAIVWPLKELAAMVFLFL